MTIVVQQQIPAARLDPVVVFEARCQARALLYYAAELSLHDAVDALQEAAVETGLVEQIGQDAVQKIIAAAFGIIWRLEQ